jgi:hypothetical protein
MAYLKKIFYILRGFFLSKEEKTFCQYSETKWPKSRKLQSKEILIELIPLGVTILPLSCFSNVLAKHFSANIKSYSTRQMTLKQKILMFKHLRIYKSFGVFKFIFPELAKNKESEELYEKAIKSIKTKNDLENFTLKGSYIGDLIYDSILRHNLYPTVDLTSELYKNQLRNDIQLFLFWENYFNTHNVMAMCVSHTCYSNNAIPIRIALLKKIKVYQCNAHGIFSLDNELYMAYRESVTFKDLIKTIEPSILNAGLKVAEERIEKRMNGGVSVDMPYSSKSAFTLNPNQTRILEDNDKIKILIASHCFFDSPHAYGNNLFTDFQVWLEYLGELGKRTDYDWYIKTHPDFLPETMQMIKNFVAMYPHIKLIPPDSSHVQIVKEKIDFVLTVYGTVGFEYAYMGVKVINASLTGPHAPFNFNFNPKSISEYEELLLNLKSLNLTINKKEILEFYFMKYLFGSTHWFYKNYVEFLAAIGGYQVADSPKIYKYFIENIAFTDIDRIEKLCLNFILCGDYWLNKGHINKYDEKGKLS